MIMVTDTRANKYVSVAHSEIVSKATSGANEDIGIFIWGHGCVVHSTRGISCIVPGNPCFVSLQIDDQQKHSASSKIAIAAVWTGRTRVL